MTLFPTSSSTRADLPPIRRRAGGMVRSGSLLIATGVLGAMFALAAAVELASAEDTVDRAAATADMDLDGLEVWVRGEKGPSYGKTYTPEEGDVLTVDEDGVIHFDTKLAGKWKMAVLRLPESLTKDLKAGEIYVFTVEAKAEPRGGTIITCPQVDEDKSTEDETKPLNVWQGTLPKWKTLTAEFVYDPDVNDGKVRFFFGPKQQGPVYQYRNLKIEKVD